MAMLLTTPPTGVAYRKQRTSLSGVDYQLFWAYNTRSDSWTLSIDAIGNGENTTPVLTGAKLHIGYDLLRRCVHDQRPTGQIWVYSTDGTRQHPGQTDLGDRCRVLYLEEGESLPDGIVV